MASAGILSLATVAPGATPYQGVALNDFLPNPQVSERFDIFPARNAHAGTIISGLVVAV